MEMCSTHTNGGKCGTVGLMKRNTPKEYQQRVMFVLRVYANATEEKKKPGDGRTGYRSEEKW